MATLKTAGQKHITNQKESNAATTNPTSKSSSKETEIYLENGQIENSEPIKNTNKDDLLTGSNDRDALFGGNGNDVIYGRQGHDKIDGGNGDDELYGDQGADELIGQNGNDLLVGGSGADTMKGGRGDDILIGESGKDTYTGGLGSDIFVLSLPGMNGQTDHEHENENPEKKNFPISAFADDTEGHPDTITDFTPGVDKIALANKVDINQVTWINTGTNDDPRTMIHLRDMTLGQLLGINAEDLSVSDFISFPRAEMT